MAGVTVAKVVPSGVPVDLATAATALALEADMDTAVVVPGAANVDTGVRHIILTSDALADRATGVAAIDAAIAAVGDLQVMPFANAESETGAYVSDFAVTLVSDDADNLIAIADNAANVDIVYTIDDDGDASPAETEIAFEFTQDGVTVPQPSWITGVRTNDTTYTLTLNPVDEVTTPGEYVISAVATNPDGNSSAADVITVTLTDA